MGLTGISQLALNRIKLAVIAIPFQLHPFGGESFSGFFHSRRIEQRPLTRLELPLRGQTVFGGSLCVCRSMGPKKSRTADKNSAALGFLLVDEHRLVQRTSSLVSIGGKFASKKFASLAGTPDWRENGFSLYK